MDTKKLIRHLNGLKKTWNDCGDGDMVMEELDNIIKELKIAERKSKFNSALFVRSLMKKD